MKAEAEGNLFAYNAKGEGEVGETCNLPTKILHSVQIHFLGRPELMPLNVAFPVRPPYCLSYLTFKEVLRVFTHIRIHYGTF